MKPLHHIRTHKHSLWKIFFRVALGGVLLVTAVGAALLWFFVHNLPSVEEIGARQVSQSTKIYDRDGTVLLYEISAGEKRTVVPFASIPQPLKDAVVSIEDERFYETGSGFDLRGIFRALFVNLIQGHVVQGASTITQQLARNAFLTPEQTITRKIKELLLSVRLNRRYSKDEILGLYLNEIPYGPTLYGIEAASRAYFGKHVEELALPEDAVLAAVIKAPSYYSPWGSHTHELLDRAHAVLKKMYDLHKVSKGDLDAALAQKIVFQPQGTGIKAPHFALAVQDYLITRYGDDMVRRGGLQVKTTLDWTLQQAAEKSVADGVARNEKLYHGTNGALVAEDPKTGQILAMVGSRNYFDQEHEGNFNVATQGLRQPGSALKPFVYLASFLKGYTPETTVFDVPTEFVPNNPRCPIPPDLSAPSSPQSDFPCFHPENFDGQFRGPVSFRRALAQSINVPAVKVLYLVGLENALAFLNDFGLTTLQNPARYGLSLVLGGGEVHLADLVGAYSALAQEGIRHDQNMILEVRDSNGTVLESAVDHAKEIVGPQYPRVINDILSDVDLRSGLLGASLGLTVFPDYDVALKTGTSNDYRDAWAIGYTPSFVVGVWAGNNDDTPMQRHGSSILAAVPIWHDFMSAALPRIPHDTFTRPDPVVPKKPVLGGDYFANGPHSILYSINRKDPLGADPIDPTTDPQFASWESGITLWVAQHGGEAAFMPQSSSTSPSPPMP